jgi:phasin
MTNGGLRASLPFLTLARDDRMMPMSDTALRNDAPAKPEARRNMASPSTAFELPKLEGPNFEGPVAFRELAEKGEALTKERFEELKIAVKETIGMAEAACTTAVKGAKDYGFKVIEMTSANGIAAIDFIRDLMTVKSLSEAVELSTAHAREQFNTISAQHRGLFALAQKVGTDVVEPIKTGMCKALDSDA